MWTETRAPGWAPPAPLPVTAVATPDPAGPAHVAYVLLLLQAALGVLATLGMILLMGGDPAYAVVGVGEPVLLAVLASRVARQRRWACYAVAVIEGLAVLGYQLNLLVGIAPQVDVTVNLVGLLTLVGLPVAVLWQSLRILRGTR
jgi:hypothetical protein